MEYHELLASMIEKSNMTLKEIAAACRKKGVRIDPSYISKLQSGNYSPASEEINRALAAVFGENPNDLLFSAYIQKAPTMIQDFISALLSFFRNIAISTSKHVPADTAAVIHQEFVNLSDPDLVQRILSEREILLLLSYLLEKRGSGDDIFKEPSINVIRKNLMGIIMPDHSMEPRIPKGARIHLTQGSIETGKIYALTTPEGIHLVRRIG